MSSVNFKTGWFQFISNFCTLLNDGYAMNVYHNRHCDSFSAQLVHLQLYCNTKIKCRVCFEKIDIKGSALFHFKLTPPPNVEVGMAVL